METVSRNSKLSKSVGQCYDAVSRIRMACDSLQSSRHEYRLLKFEAKDLRYHKGEKNLSELLKYIDSAIDDLRKIHCHIQEVIVSDNPNSISLSDAFRAQPKDVYEDTIIVVVPTNTNLESHVLPKKRVMSIEEMCGEIEPHLPTTNSNKLKHELDTETLMDPNIAAPSTKKLCRQSFQFGGNRG